jgi:hypothetical protein
VTSEEAAKNITSNGWATATAAGISEKAAETMASRRPCNVANVPLLADFLGNCMAASTALYA